MGEAVLREPLGGIDIKASGPPLDRFLGWRLSLRRQPPLPL